MQKRFQNVYVKTLEAVHEVANSSLSDVSDTDSSEIEVVASKSNQIVDKDAGLQMNAQKLLLEEAEATPKYRMASYKVVSTVLLVYKEWYEGWDGRPSIVELTEKYNLMWRYKQDEKTFSRRGKIIREIQKLVKEGIAIESAILILEARRGKIAVSSFADSL